VKVAILVVCSFLLINALLSANPFIGSWKANEVLKISVSDTTVSITVDAGGKLGVGDYPYTYDDDVIRVGKAVLVYNWHDTDTVGLLFWNDGTPTFIILVRDEFRPQKEHLES
jgi:hypothetical protein